MPRPSPPSVSNAKDASQSKKTKKLEKALEEGRAEAKREFEEERARVLDSLSESYRNMIGQIVFAKWKKESLPALILSPFSVPPGPVRTLWMNKFEKLKAGGNLDQMIYLIYWYGSRNDSEYYGFVSRSNMVSYEEEVAKGPKGISAMPTRIRQKMESGEDSKLLPKEEDILRTYQEMEEDLQKDPADRKRGVTSFQEGYEMLSMEDLKEIDLDENEESSDGDDDDENDDGSEKDDKKDDSIPLKKPVAKKPKKPSIQHSAKDDADSDVDAGVKSISKQKIKQNSIPREKLNDDADSRVVDKDDTELKPEPKKKIQKRPIFSVNEDDAEAEITDLTNELTNPHPESPPPVKKKRGRPPKLVYHDDLSVDEDLEPIGKKVKKEKSIGDTKDAFVVKEEKISSPIVEETDLADVLSDDIGDEEEETSEGDEESSAEVENDNEEEEEEEDDDDRRDHDFEEKAEKSQSTKTGKPKEKVRVARKVQKVKTKIERPKTEKQLKRLETEAFMRCETLYARLIRKWYSAIQNENLERLRRVLTEAQDVVEDFSYSFILSYDLSNICKNSKKVLKSANEDLSQFTALKEKIRTTFESKRLLVPKNYVPKKPQYNFKLTAPSTEPKATTTNEMDTSEQGKKPKPIDLKTSRGDIAAKSLSQNSLDAAAHPPQQKGAAAAAARSITTGESTVEGSVVSRPAASNTAAKPERKKFLLGSLMQPRSSSQGTSQSQRGEETKAAAEPASVPLWVTGPPTLDAPIQDPRRLALDFLLQMASHFPDGSVHVDSLARSLESAVYNWATSMSTSDDDTWIDKYWPKIHSLVAALCGKVEKGTLQDMILQGRFDTPDKIVGLSDDKFVASFEGKAVTV